MQLNSCILGDSCEVLQTFPNESISMVLCSPPYDSLRVYNNTLEWNFEIFKKIALELSRVIKIGGVIIWNVADSTKDGSESLNSFRQALFFNEVAGLRLHDTMIYGKENYVPLTHNRYEQSFEYLFCFSKGKPSTFNPIMVDCKTAGSKTSKRTFYQKSNDEIPTLGNKNDCVKNQKIHPNIFYYSTGNDVKGHPAQFPYQLAADQISTWTNLLDIVLDPFAGSGTTLLAAKKLGRQYLGIEKVPEYYNLILKRLQEP